MVRDSSYSDSCDSAPSLIAQCMALLHIRTGMSVLCVGCGSGYSVAIAALLVGQVLGS